MLSFSLFPPPALLPPSIYSSPTLCCSDEYHPSKSEMQRNLSHFSPLFPLSLSLPFSPPPSVSLALLSFSLSLSLPDFLIYLPFLPLAYVDLILSHYDDLRFSFSCWPIKTKQQQQQ